jgi:site-specific recombinase XerD
MTLLNAHEPKNAPDSTYELNLKIAAFLDDFGDRPAQEITKQEIVRWLTDEAGARGWKASSRNRWQAAFSLLFRVGIDNEKITNNPAAVIRRKTENNDKVRFLSADEEARLRQAITYPTHLDSLLISIHTGMRQSEQYTLHWRQVDLERRMLHLPKTKNDQPRHIPLNAIAVAAFERLRDRGDGKASYPVFPNGREAAKAVQGARGWFMDAVERDGITDYTWHCNRHTFASRLVRAGVSLHTVGELLGHKTAQMTKRYAHLAPQHLRAAVDKLVPVVELSSLAPVLAPAVSEDFHSELSRL